MVDKRYDKKIYELVDLVEKNGYSKNAYVIVFVSCFDDGVQALGLTEDLLDKAIELAKKGLSQQDFLKEFTMYEFMKEGIEWK